ADGSRAGRSSLRPGGNGAHRRAGRVGSARVGARRFPGGGGTTPAQRAAAVAGVLRDAARAPVRAERVVPSGVPARWSGRGRAFGVNTAPGRSGSTRMMTGRIQ